MECHGAARAPADASRRPPAGRARAGTVAPRQRRLDTQDDQVGSNTCLLRVSGPAVKVRYDRRHLTLAVPGTRRRLVQDLDQPSDLRKTSVGLTGFEPATPLTSVPPPQRT
jgi:hypothetical protein